MTVTDLKNILKDWPDIDSEGEPTEVWIETGVMLSSSVVKHKVLSGHCDLLLVSNTFEDND